MNYLELKRWDSGNVIHSGEFDSMKDLVEDAVRKGISLELADLREEDLHGANLRGSDLHGADIRWADLTGADLRGVYLSWADLRGANLYMTNLEGADLTEVIK